MKLLYFLSLIIPLNFIAGWVFLESLTVHPIKIFLTVFIFTLLLSLNLLVLVLAIKAGYVAFPVILGIIFFISGYLINTKIFLSRQDTRVVGEISRKGDGKNGHTAIVYFTHGEPETYNPIGWLNQFREFDEQGVRFIPFFARPAFIYMLRKKYLEVGKSNHRQGHIQMLGKLEDSFRQEGDSTTRFYISFLDDYLLVEQDAVGLTLFNRSAGWQPKALGVEDTLNLASVGLTVPVAEIYQGVELEG